MTTTVLINPLRFATGGTTLSGDYGTSLISHWTFDEASGNFIDSTGNYDLTNSGVGYGSTGVLNDCGDWDGTSDYAYNTSTALLNITDDITVSAWVYFDSFSSYNCVVGRDDETDGRSYAFIIRNPSGTAYMALQINGSNILLGTSESISTGAWHHVAWRGNSANGWNVWVDGTQDSTTASWTAPASSPSCEFQIGARSYNSSRLFCNARMDEITIWNRYLSDVEMGEIAGGPIPYS